jgi:hypothetical protein
MVAFIAQRYTARAFPIYPKLALESGFWRSTGV